MVETSFDKRTSVLDEKSREIHAQKPATAPKPFSGHSIVHNEIYIPQPHLPEISITMIVFDSIHNKELKRQQLSIRAMEAEDDNPTVSDSLQLCAIDFMYNPDVVIDHGKNDRSLVIEFEGVRADDVSTKWRCYVNRKLVEPRVALENTLLKDGDVVEWRLEKV